MSTPLQEMFVGDGGLSRDETLDQLAKVLRLGVDFKSRRQFCHVDRGLRPEQVMNEPVPYEGQPLDALLERLAADYLPGMPNFGSPRFVGFPDAGNSLAGIAGAILGELLNVNLINSTFCSRIATEMEIATIRWFRELVGYAPTAPPQDATEVGGMVLSGGTMANFTAVLLAREKAFPGTLQSGVTFDPARVKIIVPERIGHYTVPASLSWCGLGSGNLLRAPIKGFRYDKPSLRATLAAARDRGERVIMLVAYAGDSRTMTIDDLPGVHDLVREHEPDVWLHCDGCHGTSLCFAERHKGRLKGIEQWDSITLDPHKVLAVPYPLSMILLRSPSHSKLILTDSDLIMRQQQSLGQITPVLGSKSFQSLRLWMLLKAHGVAGIGELVDRRCDVARRLAARIHDDPRFVLINEVSINSVVFVYVPAEVRQPMDRDTADRVSTVNRHVYERVLAEGVFYLHSFVATDNLNRLGQGDNFGVNVLRYMGGNPLTTETILTELLDYLASIGERCWASLHVGT